MSLPKGSGGGTGGRNRQGSGSGGKGRRAAPEEEEDDELVDGAALQEALASSIAALEGSGSFPTSMSSEMLSALNGAAVPPDWASTTTVMMRNIPNKYTQRMLLTEINHSGFLGTFDFLYLPIDPETSANRGYCFLNFIDPSFAWMFKMSYEGNKMNRFNSSKVVSVTPATLQGFEANYAHYSSARVNRGDPSARPLFLREPKNPPAGKGAAGGAGGKRGGRKGAKGGRIGMPQGSTDPFTGMDDSSYWGGCGGFGYGMGGAASAEATPFVVEDADASRGVGEASQQMVPKFCPHCGGPIQASFQFCPGCGAALDFSMVQQVKD